MTKKREYRPYSSPKGRAGYIALRRPNDNGKYEVNLIVPEDSLEELKEISKELFIGEFGKTKLAKASWPWKPNKDRETGEVIEGEFKIAFKSNKLPKLFDSRGNPITDESILKTIGAGSKLRIQGSASPYEHTGRIGVTLYMNKIQVISLVEFSGFDSGGFEPDDEGDFVVDDEGDSDDSPPWNDKGGKEDEDYDF